MGPRRVVLPSEPLRASPARAPDYVQDEKSASFTARCIMYRPIELLQHILESGDIVGRDSTG